jgi:hypothetical protein
VAPRNIAFIAVIPDVSHPEIFLLKAEFLNVAHMFVTFSVFQPPMSCWNDVVPSNIAFIAISADVFHFEISALKLDKP